MICPHCKKEINNQRTTRQNSALHKYFELLGDELNAAGWDMRKLLKEYVSIPWSVRTIKEFIWRPIQKSQLLKESTTELTKAEVSLVYETVNRYVGEKTGVHVPFPQDPNNIHESEI